MVDFEKQKIDDRKTEEVVPVHLVEEQKEQAGDTERADNEENKGSDSCSESDEAEEQTKKSDGSSEEAKNKRKSHKHRTLFLNRKINMMKNSSSNSLKPRLSHQVQPTALMAQKATRYSVPTKVSK